MFVLTSYFSKPTDKNLPEQEFKSPEVTTMFNRWRHLWLLSMERHKRLQDMLDRIDEVTIFAHFFLSDFDDDPSMLMMMTMMMMMMFMMMMIVITMLLWQMDKLRSFDFDVWRIQYMQWMKHNKSRVMDFFYRQDRDHDGKVTRREFVDGILKSGKL